MIIKSSLLVSRTWVPLHTLTGKREKCMRLERESFDHNLFLFVVWTHSTILLNDQLYLYIIVKDWNDKIENNNSTPYFLFLATNY